MVKGQIYLGKKYGTYVPIEYYNTFYSNQTYLFS